MKNKIIYLILGIVGLMAAILIIRWLVVEPKPQGSLNLSNSSIFNQTLPNTNNVNRRPIKLPTLEKSEPNMLTIPDLKIKAPVIYIEVSGKDEDQEALAKGVVHYPGTPDPGGWGNIYIFGHSSDYAWKKGNYKTIFKPLVNVKLETVVNLSDSQGNVFKYRVKETKVVLPKDTSVMDQHNNEKQLLTIQTSYPVGTALKRFVAICELDYELTYGEKLTNTNINNSNTNSL